MYIIIILKLSCFEQDIHVVVKTSLHTPIYVSVCVDVFVLASIPLTRFVQTRISIFMYGFQNGVAKLLSLVRGSVIWKFHLGGSKSFALDKLSLDKLLLYQMIKWFD